MRFSTITIYTLAALGSGELAYKAVAQANIAPEAQQDNYLISPQVTSPQEAQQNNYAVSPQVTPPETLAAPEFARTLSGITPVSQNLAVTVTDIQVKGVSEELQQIVLNTVTTKIGGDTSENQLQNDLAEIVDTGLFANARVNTTTSPDGINVVYQVEPTIIESLQLSGAEVLTPEVAREVFQSQLGKPVSVGSLQQGLAKLNQWYQDNGYVLAQVLAVQPNPDGVLNLTVAEGKVSNIEVRFLDETGEVTEGRTKPSLVESELNLQTGEIFQIEKVQEDVGKLYQLGLFQKVDVALNGDANNLDVIYELTEIQSRRINVGGGYSNRTGVYGTVNYNDQNVGGIGNKLGLDLQLGSRTFQFDTKYGSPYRADNPDKLGYQVNAFRRRSVSNTFDDDITLGNGDEAREGRFGGGVSFNRDVEDWNTSVGVNYTRTSIRDEEGNVTPFDSQGNSLSFSDTGIDDLLSISANISKDQRDNPINPTSGSYISLGTEQSIPVGLGNILMNRLQANYSHYTPVSLLGKETPEVLAFNLKGGTVVGDLPPYEAFNLGGLNSVRGYGFGEVASSRSYVLASAEYRFPLLSAFNLPIGGVLFADFASDLGSSDNVPGEPGVARNKPGSGFGYGTGVRVNSPLGILRADLGFNDRGETEVGFGIGHRF